MTRTGISTSFDFMNLPRSSAGMHCQRLYYQHGLTNGIWQRLAPTSASVALSAPTAPKDRAPKLNPSRPFYGTRPNYKSFIIQLNLMFNSDPDIFTGMNAVKAKIAFVASFLWGSAKRWFQPHVDETTEAIAFPTWTEFVGTLWVAFEDLNAYQTVYNKISLLKQEKDYSSYYTAFISLATILRLNDRIKMSFFKNGLHAELKKALSYQITLPTGFEGFVQACIKIDNQIRANREASDTMPCTQGGQFAPISSTSTGTHSGPMDLSRAQYCSQKRCLITNQEKKRYRDNNLCLYCGSSGHWASQCPHK